MKLLALLFFGAMSWAAPPVLAQAQSAQAARFSDRGRFMLNGAVGGRASNLDSALPKTGSPHWEAFAQPNITYFVIDRIGAGFSLGGSFEQHKEYFTSQAGGDVLATKARNYELWLGPDATLEVPLVNRLSMLVLPGIYYRRTWRRYDRDSLSEAQPPDSERDVDIFDFLEHDAHFLRFSLRLPLVVHVSSSIAIGLGPVVWWDLFLSQDPAGKRVPIGVALSPVEDFVYRSDPYPRSRWVVGLASWIGGSF